MTRDSFIIFVEAEAKNVEGVVRFVKDDFEGVTAVIAVSGNPVETYFFYNCETEAYKKEQRSVDDSELLA